MAKIINPQLFTGYFGVPKAALGKADLLDPFLNADTKLFIDPVLLAHSSNKLIKTKARDQFRERLSNVMKLVDISESSDDAAWTAAMRLMDLDERRETGLGYGGSGVSGSRRPDSLKSRILSTTRDVMRLGIKNPEVIAFMSIFEADVGPDTISDLTTNSILSALQEITVGFCRDYDVPLKTFSIAGENYSLPVNPLNENFGFILVPKDILRVLPVAADWSDIDRVVRHNNELRRTLNKLVVNYAKATVLEKKDALKDFALRSEQNFQLILNGLLAAAARGYDFKRDRKNIEALRLVLSTTPDKYPFEIASPFEQSAAELWRIVNAVTGQFKNLIENNDLSRLLWDGNKPKSEKAAQLVFFGIADSYCKANDIDISPEVHSGGGPVDFKFSTGYLGRLLIEIKLSTGDVVHGYEKQLEVYKDAASSKEALFLVINVGRMGEKLKKIQKMQNEHAARGEHTTQILVVDATKKPSASKR